MSSKYIDKEEDYEESSVDTGSDSENEIKKKKTANDSDDEDSELDSEIGSSVDLNDADADEDDEDNIDNDIDNDEEDNKKKDVIKSNPNDPLKINSNFIGGDNEDEEDDEEEDEDENYLQKFDDSLKQNIIAEWHPEDQIHNDEEVETMCTIVRDSNGFIVDPLHKTLPFVTKYEKARILGERAKQLDAGAKPFVALKDNIIDSYLIALKEYEAKKIPFIVRRPLPNGACEYWRLRDLEFLE